MERSDEIARSKRHKMVWKAYPGGFAALFWDLLVVLDLGCVLSRGVRFLRLRGGLASTRRRHSDGRNSKDFGQPERERAHACLASTALAGKFLYKTGVCAEDNISRRDQGLGLAVFVQ